MLDESEKAEYEGKKIYLPGKEECKCQGGTWHKEYGCMAKISKEECESHGGALIENGGCVKPQPLKKHLPIDLK